MYLSQIAEKHQTKLFKKYFAFFAFSNKQVEEQINVNFKYAQMGSGLIAPKIFAKKIINALSTINTKAIVEHQRRESKKDIIWGTLANYETQISGDISDALEALDDYPGISRGVGK